MARLLRIHFASIGHRDARLAPLTLDFRHAGPDGSANLAGRAADSVLWLRNGGGKSSILNLFYSVFRPASREFLGSSAEGRARRLGDYVMGKDLAFVVSEWDPQPPDGTELFATAPRSVRIVGQALAWKGQRRSRDAGNLRRLFFSLRAGPEDALRFDSLPIHGLGEPVPSFDELRRWLREASHVREAQEVVYTDSQTTWLAHLGKIGLDPELFRYQLRMNQREGAADEVFRFTRDVDFVRFLLELALPAEMPDQVAQNLVAQRDNLEARPMWELERRFVSEATGQVQALAAGVIRLRDAEEELSVATRDLAEVAHGLARRATECTGEAEQARSRAEEAREQLRRTSNLRDMKQRWVRGLERLALAHDEAEARAGVEEAEGSLREARTELARGRAAEALVAVRQTEAEATALREALARERAELEPLRAAACHAGSALRALLDAEHDRLVAGGQELRASADKADALGEAADERHAEAREALATLRAERTAIDERLDRRERAREALLGRDHIEAREPAGDAVERWRRHIEERERTRETADRDREDAERRLHEAGGRREAAIAERATAVEAAAALDARLDEALAFRDRLRAASLGREVLEDDEPDLEAPRLLERLARRAGAARARLLASRVEGAEESRSLLWLREHGLLPSPIDVRRVVEAIHATGHPAHAGPEYLEQNLPATEADERLRRDPARFSGVIVPTADALARACTLKVAGLHAPVQVSLVRSLELHDAAPDAHVLLPDRAQWDRIEADTRRSALERAAASRQESEERLAAEDSAATSLAGEVRRFLCEHGSGGIERLERRTQDAQDRRRRAADELAELAETERQARADLKGAVERSRRLRDERDGGHRALEAVERFVAEHDSAVEAARMRKDAVLELIRARGRDAEHARAEAKAHRELAAGHQQEAFAHEARAERVREERDAIAFLEAGVSPLRGSLGEARVAYETARSRYEGELSDSRIKWQLERCEHDLTSLRTAFEDLARGLDRDGIRRLAAAGDLRVELGRLQLAVRHWDETFARCGATLNHASEALRARKRRRREPEDLPTDRARPADAASARRLAGEIESEVEQHAEEAQSAQQEVQRHESRRTELERLAERCRGKAELLLSNAGIAGVQLPDVAGRPPPDDLDAIDEGTAQAHERFSRACDRKGAAERQAKDAAEAVQRIANAAVYDGLAAHYRERMRDPAAVLFEVAGELSTQLQARLVVVEDALAKLDEDRRLIVEQLLHLAEGVSKLLRRAESASRLPASLQDWSGRPYLRIGFAFPERDDERRVRLEPLVDRLVAQPQLPTGLELVVRTAIELAGERGFDVKILKPDTVLRPDPVPLSLMSTFSRGQQLTAAILLYCTLVQLRARTRGRARHEDAGVLILDNPIGTCSNVALLRLQRTIAARMRVQLVYTTGVDDLEALAILPNKIRLRNTHQDRSTGNFHVTADELPEAGVVEGVRLVEVPAR